MVVIVRFDFDLVVIWGQFNVIWKEKSRTIFDSLLWYSMCLCSVVGSQSNIMPLIPFHCSEDEFIICHDYFAKCECMSKTFHSVSPYSHSVNALPYIHNCNCRWLSDKRIIAKIVAHITTAFFAVLSLGMRMYTCVRARVRACVCVRVCLCITLMDRTLKKGCRNQNRYFSSLRCCKENLQYWD